MECSVLSFFRAECKVSDTGSAQCWASSYLWSINRHSYIKLPHTNYSSKWTPGIEFKHQWCNGWSVRLECGRSYIRSLVGSKSKTKIYICCFSANYATLRSKTDWLRIRIMCPSSATCLLTICCFSELVAAFNSIKPVGLIERSPWYNWNIVESGVKLYKPNQPTL